MLGVRYKDELDMQIVLLPHLISSAEGCTMIGQEVKGLVSKGWYSLHHLLPYVPFRTIPRGAVSKEMLLASQLLTLQVTQWCLRTQRLRWQIGSQSGSRRWQFSCRLWWF